MKGFTLSAIFAAALAAHDSYIMPAKFAVKPGESLMVSIHNGDSFPSSEHATDPRRLAEVRLSDGSSVTGLQIVGRATHGFVTLAKAGSHYVSAVLHPRALELPGPKFETYLREEGLLHVIEARMRAGKSAAPGREVYTKHAKSYIISEAADGRYATPLGHAIEFVPESDPASLRRGSILRVRVLFRGKPLGGVQGQKAWTPGGKSGQAIVGRTDQDGRVAIPIDSEGKWRLHVVHMQPARDPSKADWESFWASLTFEVPPAVVTKR
jgi:uncharacterized GH25 family protein